LKIAGKSSWFNVLMRNPDQKMGTDTSQYWFIFLLMVLVPEFIVKKRLQTQR